jgi:preprotein translocase subunit YajC
MNETQVQAAPAATVATTTQPVETPAAPVAQNKPSMLGSFVPMLLILGIFYFMMIRPQQRKEKERRKMIEELRAGAHVIAAGGIVGTILEAKEKTFVIETGDKSTVEVLRSSVQGIVTAEGNQTK